MSKQPITLAVAGAIIGAALVSWVPATSAAPVSSSMTAFKQATLSDVTDVRYYRRYYGRRVYPGAAIGLGIAGAAAAAAAAGSGYYYGPGYYGPGYGYPGYYGPGYGYYVAPYPYRRYYYPY
jgi:hypothetical protein